MDNFNENNFEKQEIVDFVKQLCAAIGQLIPGFEVMSFSFLRIYQLIADIFAIDKLLPFNLSSSIQL